MPWFNVDDGFCSHAKALATPLEARGLWVTAGSWCSRNLTDGFVPSHVLPSLGGTPTLAETLVAAGLWKRRKGGYAFHDWTKCNPTRKEVLAMRAKKAAAGRKGGLASANARSKRQAPAEPRASPVVQPQSLSSYRAKDAGARGAVCAATPANPKTRAKPAWCGVCDRDTRLTGPPDQPYRCPECHPIDSRRARL